MKKVIVQFDGIVYVVSDMKGVWMNECVDYQKLDTYLKENNLDIHGAIIDNSGEE